MNEPILYKFWCPACGEGVASDEDRCCATCGATLIENDVYAAIFAAGQAHERERCLAVLHEVHDSRDDAWDEWREACAQASCAIRDPEYHCDDDTTDIEEEALP